MRAESSGPVLALRADGIGRAVRLDRRGRLYLPGWLRQVAGAAVVVSARQPEPTTVVVAPCGVLDGLVEALAGEVG